MDYALFFSWHAVTATISAILSVVAVMPYLKDMLRGETRPNVISFTLWTILGTITLLAQIKAGWSLSIVVVTMTTLNALMITLLALFGYGYRKFGNVERYSLIFAVAAIIGWQLTSNPLVAIAFSILADVCALIPTLVKTYHAPESESTASWAIITTAYILGVLSTNRIDFANLAMPLYLTCMGTAIWAMAYFGKVRQLRR